MAKRLWRIGIWRTGSYGESTMANRHMANWNMAKQHHIGLEGYALDSGGPGSTTAQGNLPKK